VHELALTCSIVEIAEQAAQGNRVVRLTLVIGKLAGVMTEAIRFCFDAVARGTSLEGAVLDIVEPDGLARCADCGAEFATPDLFTACSCGSLAFTRLQGGELTVKSIELEEAA
jgi:hydrogenase nickel incorporation protein HypA/HybF